MPKGAFTSATLQPDGTVEVIGPFSLSADDPSKPMFVSFYLVQGAPGAEITVDGEGRWMPGEVDWKGTGDSGQLTPGTAHGSGVIIVVHDDPPAFVTYSWNSPVEVTEA